MLNKSKNSKIWCGIQKTSNKLKIFKIYLGLKSKKLWKILKCVEKVSKNIEIQYQKVVKELRKFKKKPKQYFVLRVAYLYVWK